MRVIINLACGECKQRNYVTTKNKKTHPDRLELRKYDPVVKRHVVFKEAK